MPSPESLITEKDIAANRAAENELTELILSRESVAVVGAGFSHDCGFPTWDDLLADLRARAEELDRKWVFPADADRHLEYADSVYECITAAGGREAFGDEIGRIFSRIEQRRALMEEWVTDVGARNASAPEASVVGLRRFHLQLVELPFRGILTTNYDHLLEDALAKSGRCSERPVPVPVWNGAPSLISRAVRGLAVDSLEHVIHLHGDYLQPSTVVLTGRQYSEAYGLEGARRSRLFHLLLGILMTRRLVFVGFGLRDRYIEEMISMVSDFGWEWGAPIHFAILARMEANWPEQKRRAARLKETLGIQVVFYDARPDDHSELHALVERIHRAYSSPAERGSGRALVSAAGDGELPQWARSANRAAVRKVGGHED